MCSRCPLWVARRAQYKYSNASLLSRWQSTGPFPPSPRHRAQTPAPVTHDLSCFDASPPLPWLSTGRSFHGDHVYTSFSSYKCLHHGTSRRHTPHSRSSLSLQQGSISHEILNLNARRTQVPIRNAMLQRRPSLATNTLRSVACANLRGRKGRKGKAQRIYRKVCLPTLRHIVSAVYRLQEGNNGRLQFLLFNFNPRMSSI